MDLDIELKYQFFLTAQILYAHGLFYHKASLAPRVAAIVREGDQFFLEYQSGLPNLILLSPTTIIKPFGILLRYRIHQCEKSFVILPDQLSRRHFHMMRIQLAEYTRVLSKD